MRKIYFILLLLICGLFSCVSYEKRIFQGKEFDHINIVKSKPLGWSWKTKKNTSFIKINPSRQTSGKLKKQDSLYQWIKNTHFLIRGCYRKEPNDRFTKLVNKTDTSCINYLYKNRQYYFIGALKNNFPNLDTNLLLVRGFGMEKSYKNQQLYLINVISGKIRSVMVLSKSNRIKILKKGLNHYQLVQELTPFSFF